jgi:hypothetical protein
VITDDKLDFWFNNRRNVLFVGRHGCGKTAKIQSCFEKNGLILGETFLYFSASTLDPWVDLIGVPKEKTEDGITYLELIRPKALAAGKVEAIFFDEFNRSPKKVRNAVMELVQFRSINGLKFPNLKCIWAAINPEEDDVYDVEKIDPAQKDRFHIIKEIEYAPNRNWFIETYGHDTATAAIEWWNDLPDEEKDKISPRRLAYALDEFNIGGSLQDILPPTANVNKLMQTLRNGPIEFKLQTLYKEQNLVASKTFLANDNNYFSAVKYITASQEYTEFFVPLFPKEKLVALMSDNDSICRFVANKSSGNKFFWELLREIVMANADEKLVKKFRRFVSAGDDLILKECVPGLPEKPYFNKDLKATTYSHYSNYTYNTLEEREKMYASLKTTVAEDITADDAKNIIYALSLISKDLWSSMLLSPSFNNLVGIINHCLKKIKDETNEKDILEGMCAESKDVNSLMMKLQMANLLQKVLRV